MIVSPGPSMTLTIFTPHPPALSRADNSNQRRDGSDHFGMVHHRRTRKPPDVHVAADLDERGSLRDETFNTTESDYKKELGWPCDFGSVELVGVEGTGSYGATRL